MGNLIERGKGSFLKLVLKTIQYSPQNILIISVLVFASVAQLYIFHYHFLIAALYVHRVALFTTVIIIIIIRQLANCLRTSM